MDDSISFSPPWYLKSGHLQTLLTGIYKPKADLPEAIEHRISIDPYGEILVYENSPSNALDSKNQEAVFLLHGLGSSHRGTYMTYLTQELLLKGKRVFRFDLPGAGDSYRYTSLPPHGACAPLLARALNQLSDTLSIHSWRAIGVSLGGNLLLKLLAGLKAGAIQESPIQFQINKAVSVAPPIDLQACCEHMERGLNRIYAKYFLRSLKKQSKIRAAFWPQWQERLNVADFSTIRTFDETVTAPLAGFSSASEYYRIGSTKNELSQISVPLTVLIDRQDPIVPYSIFKNVDWPSTVRVHSTERGGHVGYIYRARNSAPKRFARWADSWIVTRLLADEP